MSHEHKDNDNKTQYPNDDDDDDGNAYPALTPHQIYLCHTFSTLFADIFAVKNGHLRFTITITH